MTLPEKYAFPASEKNICLECCPHSRGVLEPEAEAFPTETPAKIQGKSAKIRGGLCKNAEK